MIYTDRLHEIYKYTQDSRYNIIVEVWKEGRLIAGLFSLEEGDEQ